MTDPYHIFAPSARSDHELHKRLRQENPVYSTTVEGWGTRHWFLTRYEDCNNFMRDSRFGRDLHNTLPDEILVNWQKPSEVEQMIERHLLGVDPPDHTRMRGLVHKAFTPRVIRNLEERVQEVANRTLDEVAEAGEMDLIEQYAFPIPITLISEMLGIPADDRLRFRGWVQNIFNFENEMARNMAAMEFLQYMNERIEERRTNPRDDLLSGMVQAEQEGEKLSHHELISMIFLLLTAGYETTVHLIASGVYCLLTNPDQLAMFRAEMDTNPDLVKSTVEETVRYAGPASATLMRWAWEDVPMGDQIIQKGDAVNAFLLSTNRDPEIFDEPDRFDITRQPNPHLGFGAGIHYCLGAPLARMEGAIALPTLLRRFPDLKLAIPANQVKWSVGLFHGLEALPVTF